MSRVRLLASIPILPRCNHAQKIQIGWMSDTTKYTNTESKVNKTDKETTALDNTSLYKVAEYFQYTQFSYYDIETEMLPKRLPQPSPH